MAEGREGHRARAVGCRGAQLRGEAEGESSRVEKEGADRHTTRGGSRNGLEPPGAGLLSVTYADRSSASDISRVVFPPSLTPPHPHFLSRSSSNSVLPLWTHSGALFSAPLPFLNALP